MFWKQGNKAVYRKSNSIKDTLFHEFMHHYDYEVLKFPASLHTAGFYYRLGDVMKKLIG